MATSIEFSGGRAEARRAISYFLGMLTGRNPDQGRLARSVFLAMGVSVLGNIQQDFIRKARGGIGEDGVKWEPLSKEYLAYGRRFEKGEQAKLKAAAGLGRSHNRGVGGNTGLLTSAQQKRWNQVYAQTLGRLTLSSVPNASSIAAGHAWNVLKNEGAKTKLEVFGNRQVEILKDTGVLLNSLSMGYLSDGNYEPPSVEGGDKQIMEAIENGVIVGTAVPYAGIHQNGSKKKTGKGGGIPARPFLPDKLPDSWRRQLDQITIRSIVLSMKRYLLGGG